MKIGSIFLVFSVVYTECLALKEHTTVKTIEALKKENSLSVQCARSYKLYMDRLNQIENNEDIWALKMLDATSKIPVGLLSYNFGEMGHFQQCIEINSQRDRIKGKYCIGNVLVNRTNAHESFGESRNQVYFNTLISNIAGGVKMVGHPTWAICIPSNCTNEDALHLMSMSQTLGMGIDSVTCQTIEDANPPLDTAAFIGISILSVLLLIVITSTAYDVHYQNKNKDSAQSFYTAFSVYTNGKKVFQIQKRTSSLSCLDGIRVLSMTWVITLHTYSFYTKGPVFNSKDIVNLTNSIFSMIFINGDLACDTFLIVGGTLVTYVFFKKEKKEEITYATVMKHYFHRYIRLTPPLAGVVLVSATLIKYMGSGPKWPHIVNYFQGFCTKYWWSSLLYIQNEVNVNRMCAGHTWYLNVDMQLYILSPFIFWLLQKYTKTGITFLVCGVLSSILTSFSRAMEDELAGIRSNYYSKTPPELYMNDYYLKTETRAAPWFIGTILGYMLTRKQFMDVTLPKKIVIPMWILSMAVMFLCVLGGHSTLRGPEYYMFQNALYIALVRPSFALAVGWIIWACATNHGGIVNSFLSLSVFQFMNKFIYSMYLLHVTSLYMIVYGQKTSIYFTVFNMAYWFWGIFMLMFGLSIIWVLIFESPMVVLEKSILKKFESSRSLSIFRNQVIYQSVRKISQHCSSANSTAGSYTITIPEKSTTGKSFEDKFNLNIEKV